MKRNRERVASLGTPAHNSSIALPFILVNTSKKTTIDCSISSDKYVNTSLEIHCTLFLSHGGFALKGLCPHVCQRLNI